VTATIIPFPVPIEKALRSLRARCRVVACPHCGAVPGRPCVNRNTAQVRVTGPHPDRIAVAEAALEGERNVQDH
jgi:hypothetical protein